MGLRLITNQRQDLVLAIKVLAKGVLAVKKGAKKLQAITEPKNESSGGFGCLQSCGQ